MPILSPTVRTIESMFEGQTDADVVDAIAAAAREQNVQCARELAAIGELYARRAPEGDTERDQWAIDGHANVVAEISAALRITRARASGHLRYAIALRERLPRLAEVFARGDVCFRVVATVISRVYLVQDPKILAELDQAIARRAPKWTRLSTAKLGERIDMWVVHADPAGVRVPPERDDVRFVEVKPSSDGMAQVWAQLHGSDGVALDQKLEALADTVCREDPRNKEQRRADALRALVDGADGLQCQCGSSDCAAAQRKSDTNVVIHVLAERATIDGASEAPGYLPGFGPVSPALLRDLATTAKLKDLVIPPLSPEPGYRPSAALADFVRCRDLTCRFPGCDAPAAVCDIDHTIPYPLGPTHACNLKLLCRFHHLLKTFYAGVAGWLDLQLPDGTVVWTSPTGHIYRTEPTGGVFFESLSQPTPMALRGLKMPRRKRTRAAERHARIMAERRINEERFAAQPPPDF